MNTAIALDRAAIEAFCHQWKVSELSLFGSVLRGDFRPESDVDVLIAFRPDASWGLLDHARMTEELAAIVGRRVDLVSRRAVERSANWIRRNQILSSAEPYFVAR